ncbi:hypothetical protein ACLOJK_004535 [Asimina triloba]
MAADGTHQLVMTDQQICAYQKNTDDVPSPNSAMAAPSANSASSSATSPADQDHGSSRNSSQVAAASIYPNQIRRKQRQPRRQFSSLTSSG